MSRPDGEIAEEALCLTPSEWTTLEGVCNHYLFATGWADSTRKDALQASKDVMARRELCRRILGSRLS